METKHLTNDALLDLLEDGGSPESRVHLAGCAACRSELDLLRPIREDLGGLARARADAKDPEIVRKIMGRLGPTSHRKVYRRRVAPWRWIAGAAAAAAAVIAIVLSVQKPAEPPAPDTAVTPAPQAPLPPEPRPPAPKPEPVRTPAPKTIPPAPKPPPAPEPAPPAPPVPKPKPPTPEPTPPPKKAAPPAPKETKPEPVFVTIARVEGIVEREQDDKWARLATDEELRWNAGTPLRSKGSVARFTLADGVRVTLWPRSELHLVSAQPPTLSFDKGWVYCVVPPEKGRDFRIATPDARVAVTGTRFGVRRHADHTQVIVSDGEVRVSNDKGERRVPAGTGLIVRKQRAPGKPRIVDVDSLLSWGREIGPREKGLFRYTFENGRRPYPWTSGTVVPGPARGINRHCMQSEGDSIGADLSRVNRRHTVYRKGLLVRVRFYATDGDEFWIQFFSERLKDNFRFHLRGISTGKWETFELPLSDLYLLSDRNSHPQEGERLTWLSMGVAGATGPVYFDDVELVEVQPR